MAGRARRTDKWDNTLDPVRRLRVGLVSGDLCSHPVGHFVESVLAALAAQPSRDVEMFAYLSYFISDAVTERIKASCRGAYSVVGLSDEALAQMKPVPRARTLRRALGLTQEEFAARYHIPIGTLRDWEQGRSEPDQPARAYLTVISRDPEGVRRALEAKPG